MNSCTIRQHRARLRAMAVCCLIIAAGCSSIEKAIESAPRPSASVIGAGVRNLSLHSLDLVFDVEVTNPYDVSLPLVDASYTLDSGKQQLLTGRIKPSGAVPARGSSVIQLPARVDLAALLDMLAGVRPGALVPYRTEISIVVNAPLIGDMALPLERKGEIPIPAIPEITLASFDIGEMRFDRVEAEARLRVRNTNQFRIDVVRLRFDLKLSGKNVASVRLRRTSRLAAGQTAILEVPVSISPAALGAGLMELLDGNDAGYDLSGRLELNSRFGEFTLPFNQLGQAPLRR
jgi:LEA14-like dessication related protein